MTDLQAKYQKLATEYSKLRAQVPVLKKAVLDEQAKQEELKETIKTRDQTVRQYEQETDSLMFRNRQLSSRVSILQEELDRSDVKHAKHKQDKRAVQPPELSAGDTVLGEELKSKIEENARLHRQVFESVEKHQQSENELHERMRQLTEELSQQKQLLTETEQTYLQQLDTLQAERAKVKVQLQQQEQQLKEAQQKVKSLQTPLRSVTEAGSTPPSNSIIEQTTVFNETPGSHGAGVAGLQQWRKATPEMAPLVVALIRCLVRLSSHSRQRWARMSDGSGQLLPDVSTKTADVSGDFAETLKRCADNIAQLLPQQVHSLDEDCHVSTCTEGLAVRNRQLKTSLRTFSSSLSHLQTHISRLTAQSGCHGNQATQSMEYLPVDLVQAGGDFHKATTDLSKQFRAKLSVERQLSTATQKWKDTDDHIMSTLDSLVTFSSQLAGFLKDKFSVLCEVHSADGPSGHAKLEALSGDVLENGQTESPASLSTHSLAKQVATLQDRLCHLEQDKEKWMLDIELQQMKYEKLLQKAAHLEETLQKMGLSSDATTTSTSASPIATDQTPTSKCTVSTLLIGQLEVESCEEEEESETREGLIKQYFSRRLAEVTKNLQTADSKALHLHAECCALHGRLCLTVRDRESLQEELALAKELVVQVKDELQTMTDGYKSQLSTMTEHLAGMNDKLTAQKDEIDMLKYQLHSLTTNKKGRGK